MLCRLRGSLAGWHGRRLDLRRLLGAGRRRGKFGRHHLVRRRLLLFLLLLLLRRLGGLFPKIITSACATEENTHNSSDDDRRFRRLRRLPIRRSLRRKGRRSGSCLLRDRHRGLRRSHRGPWSSRWRGSGWGWNWRGSHGRLRRARRSGWLRRCGGRWRRWNLRLSGRRRARLQSGPAACAKLHPRLCRRSAARTNGCRRRGRRWWRRRLRRRRCCCRYRLAAACAEFLIGLQRTPAVRAVHEGDLLNVFCARLQRRISLIDSTTSLPGANVTFAPVALT